MKVLYHVSDLPINEQLDTSLYHIKGGEPIEIESDFHAHKLLEYFGDNFGLIEVHTRRTPEGIKYDLVEARDRAEKALFRGERMTINRYIQTQLEDRLRKNFPALPPNSRVQQLIAKHDVNLADYGIRPVGMPLDMLTASTPLHTGRHNGNGSGVNAEEFARLQEDNAIMRQQLNELIAALGGKGKRQQAPATTEAT